MTDALLTLARAHQWTPVELALVFLACSVLLSMLAMTLVEWAFAVVRRRRARREVVVTLFDEYGETGVIQSGRQGGLSRHADPARVHRETARELRRLAARPTPAHPGAARRVDAPGVVAATALSPDAAGVAGKGRSDLDAGHAAVSRPAQGVVHDGRPGLYGRGTTLVFPLAPEKRVTGNGR